MEYVICLEGSKPRPKRGNFSLKKSEPSSLEAHSSNVIPSTRLRGVTLNSSPLKIVMANAKMPPCHHALNRDEAIAICHNTISTLLANDAILLRTYLIK